MSKTLLKFDSSDDESSQTNDNALDSLYLLGNRILSDQKVDTIYRNTKKNIGYKTDQQHSQSVLQHLINNTYTPEVLYSINTILVQESVAIIEKVRQLYTALSEIQEKYAKKGINTKGINTKGQINLENFEALKILKKYLLNQEDLQNQEDLCDRFGIDEDKLPSFLQEILVIESIKDNLYSLEQLRQDYPLLSPQIVFDDNKTLLCISDASLNKSAKLICSIRQLYTALSEIQEKYAKKGINTKGINTKGQINLENFEALKILKKYLLNQEDLQNQEDLCDRFGIDEDKLPSFLQEISNIKNILDNKENINKFLTLVKNCPIHRENIWIDVISDVRQINNDVLKDIENYNLIADFNQISHSNCIKENIGKLKLFEQGGESGAIKFLANGRIYQKLLKTTTKALKIMKHPDQEKGEYNLAAPNAHRVKVTHEWTAGWCRKDLVVSLGTYEKIATELDNACNQLNISSNKIGERFQNILQGSHFQYKDSEEMLAAYVLYDIAYLLFSCEPNRNPSALITNAMFFELMTKGTYKLKDMATKMPMAIKGAIDVGRYYHRQFEQSVAKAKKNDYGSTNLKNTSDKVLEFQEREYKLLCNFFDKNIVNKSIYNAREDIKEELKKLSTYSTHQEEQQVDNFLGSLGNVDWFSEKCVDSLEKFPFENNNGIKELKKLFNDKKKEHDSKYYELINTQITEMLIENSNEIEKLIRRWYLPKFTLETMAEQSNDSNSRDSKVSICENDEDNDAMKVDGGKSKFYNKQKQNFNTSKADSDTYYKLSYSYSPHDRNAKNSILKLENAVEEESIAQIEGLLKESQTKSKRNSCGFQELLEKTMQKKYPIEPQNILYPFLDDYQHSPQCSSKMRIDNTSKRELVVNIYIQYNKDNYELLQSLWRITDLTDKQRTELIHKITGNNDLTIKTIELIQGYKELSPKDREIFTEGCDITTKMSNLSLQESNSRANDIDGAKNAFNQKDNQKYLYQNHDILSIQKQLLKNYPEFVQCDPLRAGDDQPALQTQNELINIIKNAKNGTKFLGVFNPTQLHWVAFYILKNENGLTLLYKDSKGNDAEAFLGILSKQATFNIITCIHESYEQTSGDECGIFALKNMQIMAQELQNDHDNFVTEDTFKNYEKWCTLGDAQKMRCGNGDWVDDFPKLYKTQVINENKDQIVGAELIKKLEKNHEDELEQLAKVLSLEQDSYKLYNPITETSDLREEKILLEIVINNFEEANYTYQYQLHFPKENIEQGKVKSQLQLKDKKFQESDNKIVIEPEDMVDITKTNKENIQSIRNDLTQLIENNKSSGLYQELQKQLSNAHVLSGSGEFGEEKNIDYIHSYFGKYTLDTLDRILHLRISDLQLKNIEIIQGVFIDQNHNNIPNLLSQILNSSESKFLVPLNLFNKHATGLVFEKIKDDVIQVKYFDSLNKHMPKELVQLIIHSLGVTKINFQEIAIEQQKYANCGVEVIENFIQYLTGKRVSQEKAIELHSKLVENSLLNIESRGVHLLFEEKLDNSAYSLNNELEQILQDNNLFHNFDYDKYQIDLLGHHDAV